MTITKAAVFRGSGRERPYASSRPVTVEELELEAPFGSEVAVRVSSAGLCHSDLSVISGVRNPPLPVVLGHECAGVVEEVGEQVSSLKKGDHVVLSFVPSCGKCQFCLSGRPSLCDSGRLSNRMGTLLDGARKFKKAGEQLNHHVGVSAFSERTVVMENSAIKVRDDLPLDKAALFGCAVVTGIGAVVNAARVKAGDIVAVFGCGGVGLNAVQGAVLAGANRVLAVDLVAQKLDLATRFGATDVVDASVTDPVDAIRKMTGGQGVDCAIEAIGNTRVIEQAYRSTRKGGKTVVVGVTSLSDKVELPSSVLVDEERSIIGSYMGSSVPQRDIPALIDLYMRGRVKIDELVTRFIGLEEINEGLDTLATGAVARQLISF